MPGPSADAPSRRQSTFARLLSPIADVRPGEIGSVLLMALTMLMLMSAFYMLKTARESLILTQGGAEVKAYVSAGQAVLLLVIVPTINWLASRSDRIRLIRGVTLFCIANLLLFVTFGPSTPRVGIVYFV